MADNEELKAAIERMIKIGSCYWPSLSPDARRVAFVSDLSGVPQVWTVATSGGWPEQVTALSDPVSRVAWSPTGEWLACLVAPGGGMNQQVYIVRPDGSDLRRITLGGLENNSVGDWMLDGKALSVSSNSRRAEAMDSYLYDLASDELRLVAENPGLGFLIAVSKDGRRGILNRMENRSDNNLVLLDIASGAKTVLTPHDGPGSFDFGAFSPDGQTIYLSSNFERDLTAFAKIELDENGRPGPIEVIAGRDEAELQSVHISEDGTTAVLIWNVAGRSELAYCDLATQTVTNAPPLPSEIVLFEPSLSHDGRYIALALAGSASPRDIWVFDRTLQTYTQLTHSPHPAVKLNELVKPELVEFTAHDGLKLTAWLYRPKNFSQAGPCVLNFHGGPESQERPDFNGIYQALLGQGIAVLGTNVRGSSGFGKTFVNLDNGPLRFDAIKDIQACVDYVVQAGIADPQRIGIMGGSYGGYMTMAGLTEYPQMFAAGANLFGIVNFETFFAHTEPWMAAVSKIEYGDPDTQAEMLRQLSPIHKIEQVQAPTLVLHGANDTNVPVVEAEQVVERLRQKGVPVEYILFPDEGHGFRKLPNRLRAGAAIVEWFAKYL